VASNEVRTSASQHGGQFFFFFYGYGVWCLVVRGPVFLYIHTLSRTVNLTLQSTLTRTVTTGDQYVGTSLLVTVLTWSGVEGLR
jgi:hypothetical protein